MKSNKVVKFTLTAICMAVLSACGSDGDSKPAISSTTNTTTQQQQQAAAEAAAAKAAAEKATAEAAAAKAAAEAAAKQAAAEKAAAAKAAAEAAAQKAAADKVLADAAKAAADKAAAEKAAAEEAKKAALEAAANKDNVAANVYVAGQESNVGAKQVVLNTNAKGEKTSNFGLHNAGVKDVAGTPSAMNMELHPSLDTVVVVTTKENATTAEKRGYLEDFDFRGSTTANAKDGTYLLQNIYLQQGSFEKGTKTTSAVDTKGAVLKRAVDATKTETHGKGAGVAYVYQNDRANYTDYSGKVVKADGTANTAVNNQAARSVEGTVAEMYGHLTFAEGTVADRNVTNNKPKDQAKLANLPLAADGHSKVLNNVQYGRVTTHLNGHSVNDYKQGVLEDTFVVNYGLQGQAGTEDHYIYRGVNNTTAAQLAALGSKTFTYEGHAVSYGLDNKYQSFEKAGRPNALGSKYSFVSGNHVTATVNTANNSVTGNIHNKWFDNTVTDVSKALTESKLVTFDGKLHSNGAITGTSTNVKTSAGGTFAATLFGDKAQEIGGSVASTDKTAGKAWGAVFGANRKLETAKPTTPTSGLNESTNAN